MVTIIEVLSPANKSGDGREKYIQKQTELLNAQVNLVEIDLLSGPTATLARAFEVNSPPDWRYNITISRPHQRHKLEIYAMWGWANESERLVKIASHLNFGNST